MIDMVQENFKSFMGSEDKKRLFLYTATLILAIAVIPAKAGIQEKTGFRVKPGMTKAIRFMSSGIRIHSAFSAASF
jgi:hypothetical protein